MSKIAITWKVSTIGYKWNQQRTIRALGLRRLHQTVIHEDTPAIRGMVNQVIHLLEVADAPSSDPPSESPSNIETKSQSGQV